MQFTEDKIRVICEKLAQMKTTSICKLDNLLYCKTEYKKSNVLPDTSTLSLLEDGMQLYGKDSHYWIYKKLPATKRVSGKRLYFSLRTGYEKKWDATNPQCLVYLNGKMVQGLDVNHTELLLDFDTEYDMYIYLYLGNAEKMPDFSAELILIDDKIETLYYDLQVPYEAAMCFDSNNESRITTLKHLQIALNFLDLQAPFSENFYKSMDDVENYLYENFYNSSVCGSSDVVVDCIGHTHIDLAWLWTLQQTVEKAQRSFSTVISLMKQYPEYKFMSSQPQLYEFVKENAPELYEEIKEMIKQGRWEPDGAMWLESDCNLTSGESLIRQIMFGKRFMKDEFGVDSKCVWLPDVFGCNGALPQIMKKCGIESFITAKMAWSETNEMPYDTFMWEGIDGSEIFSHFITTPGIASKMRTTYTGRLYPYEIIGTWKNYKQKEFNNETLTSFGFGDGGGGPTAEMLEYQRRLCYGLPGVPKTRIEHISTFLKRIKDNFKHSQEQLKITPRWVGELYLEYHRGTYTSIAKNKKNNRKSELLLQAAEQLSVSDMILQGKKYEHEAINQAWKTVLLNQFHDIIPGTAIEEVYKRCDTDYAEVTTVCNRIKENALNSIASNVKSNGGIFVYNPNGFVCSSVVDCDGEKIYVKDIPACGYKVVEAQAIKRTVIANEKLLENDFYKVKFDENMNIISLYDKENNREVVKPDEKLNRLQVFEDIPRNYDAWEISEYYTQKMRTIDNVHSTQIIDETVRKGIKITRNYLDSKIVQTIFLYDDLHRIDFEVYIDWKQEHILLKAAFPFDIHANEATYDIQFGNIKRATHENTSWDRARFEVCAHKWADISDGGYGVSLLNDCKYGYSAVGSTLKLTMLKCATFPNPRGDQEIHEFKYSLVSHAGSFREAGIVQEAALFNQPLIAKSIPAQNGTLNDTYSLISCDSDNIMVDTIKMAENGEGVIVRLFDAFDKKSHVKIKTGFDIEKAFICDMLENIIEQIEIKDNEIEINVSNFEVATLKLMPTHLTKTN